MMRFAVDELNSDRVLGWAFDPGTDPAVIVVVDGKPVGRARTGAYRIDVAQSLNDERAAQCGFEFRFGSSDFKRVAEGRASVALQIGEVSTEAVVVPVLAARTVSQVRRAPGLLPRRL
jgi:hypothetical protein